MKSATEMPSRMMVRELAAELDERKLSLQVHQTTDAFIVWLYAPDDPAILITSEDHDLSRAIQAAIDGWDGSRARVPGGGS